MMTRKDYVLIANSIRESLLIADAQERIAINFVALNIMKDLQRHYPKFKREVFLRACGIEDLT